MINYNELKITETEKNHCYETVLPSGRKVKVYITDTYNGNLDVIGFKYICIIDGYTAHLEGDKPEYKQIARARLENDMPCLIEEAIKNWVHNLSYQNVTEEHIFNGK